MRELKYQDYKAVDYLKDDDFLTWVMLQSEEDILYWEELMEQSPRLKPTIEEAIELYHSEIRFNYYPLTAEQKEDSYKEFRRRVGRQNKQRHFYYWLSGVASVLLIFAVNHMFQPFAKQESALEQFVNHSASVLDTDVEDIQLYVSSDNLIEIEDKEANISYHNDTVKITGKSLTEVNSTEYSRLYVPKGRRSKLVLADGSTLHVNSGTQVVYPNRFTDKTREIYVKGEVYLDVSHNPKQPFIVKTDDISVRVTGTQFNVQAYEESDHIEVVLASGGVQIRSNHHSGKTDLMPSQLYDYKEGRATVREVDVEKYISWIHGVLYVEDECLDLVMIKLSRYYGKEILIDEALNSQKCTGKIDLKEDLGDVLSGLTFSFPIKVEQEGDTYHVNIKR